MIRRNKVGICFFVCLTVMGCSKAETLSLVSPAAINLSNENVDWNNGIADLVRERCASCHAHKRGRFVPEATPLLDFTIESEFLSVRNRSLQRIQDTSNPMPPNYSDPLSNEERLALLNYLSESLDSH